MSALAFPDGTADLARGILRYQNGHCCVLTPREKDLLCYLAAHSGRVISRAEILSKVWGLNPSCTTTRRVDMHLAHLRQKLHDARQRPKTILTVHGQGYLLSMRVPST